MNIQKAVILFEKIRDLPYGTSGSDEVWSCYQKCVLLKQDLQIPEHILKIRRHQYERHVILRVFIDEFAYDVDPSIDIGLAPILPIACWDGKSSTTTMVPLRRLRIYRPHSLHECILSQLRRKVFRSNPEGFYTAIDAWLAIMRAS